MNIGMKVDLQPTTLFTSPPAPPENPYIMGIASTNGTNMGSLTEYSKMLLSPNVVVDGVTLPDEETTSGEDVL